MFSLESPHQGDSNEYKQHAIFNIIKKITLNYPKYNNVCSFGIFSLGTQERVRKSRGKRAIGVRATEVLLYLEFRSNLRELCPFFTVKCQNWDTYNNFLCSEYGYGDN